MALVTIARNRTSKVVAVNFPENKTTAWEVCKAAGVGRWCWMTFYMIPHRWDQGCDCYHCKLINSRGKEPHRAFPDPDHSFRRQYKRPGQWAFRRQVFDMTDKGISNKRFNLNGGEFFVIHDELMARKPIGR